MTTEDRGAAGPYTAYDGLPPLHASVMKLPLIHPYAPVIPGRYVTPGGGRLTIRKPAKTFAHLRITLDHLGCAAQLTEEKNAAFKRLALASEGYCFHAKCWHRTVYVGGVLRSFKVRTGSIQLAAFVRAALAIELGDFSLADRLLKETETLVGPVRLADGRDEEDEEGGQAEAG
ncbi:DUF6420 family protein [Streptomyces hirsutus]|uniref:DUF6420 family protein n=1 Tax=Streptomyces hirsutus TaxID=35620 RepID=UPI0033FB1FF8